MIDPEIVGRKLAPVRFPIDRSKLAELARAFFDQDPVWYDPDAAQAAGFETLPTPPTVTVLVDHWREGGALALAEAIGADLRRVLHGQATWEYLGPVRAGDELTATTSVTDVSTRDGKRGGSMTLVTVQTDFVNQENELVVQRTDVLIETEGAA
jgi:acyl dehydratase